MKIRLFFIFWMVLGGVLLLRGQEYDIEFVTRFKYSLKEVRPFSEGIAAVRRGNLWGLIDIKGKTVILPKYYSTLAFSEGLCAVKSAGKMGIIGKIPIAGKWGYIDKRGQEVIKAKKYYGATLFSGEVAAVRTLSGWGYIDKTGEEVIPFGYDKTLPFLNGFAKVRSKSQWGMIDEKGNEVLPPIYQELRNFYKNRVAALYKDQWYFVNKTNKLISKLPFEDVHSFSNGLCGVKYNDKWGFINYSGEEVIPVKYAEIGKFKSGIARVRLHSKWRYINKKGQLIMKIPKYDEINDFSEGYALVKYNEKWGYINTSGKEITKIIYDDATLFSEGYALVKYNNKWGYIDTTGKAITQIIYDDATSFSEGHAWVKKDGRWVIIKKVNYANKNTLADNSPTNALAPNQLIEGKQSTIKITPPSTEQSTPNKPPKPILTLPKIEWTIPTEVVQTDQSTFTIEAKVKSNAPPLEVWHEIKGHKLDVVSYKPKTETYTYKKIIQLIPGENVITLFAKNRVGEVQSKPLKLTYVPPPKVWAVIVGIEIYKEASWLSYARNDASEFSGFLRSPEGGGVPRNHIHLLLNERATKANILTQLQTIKRKSRPQDRVVFYFSGHGRDGAFLPYDFQSSDASLLHHSEISDILKTTPAKHKVIIADACHSGSFRGLKGSDKPINRYYDALSQSKGGTVLMASCQSNEVAVERNGLQQSVFSFYLLEGLMGGADTNKDKKISIQEAFQYAVEGTKTYTNESQNPVIQGDYDPNMIIGVVRN